MKKYLSIEDVRVLNIEHTSMCNLRCPQCARVINGKTSPELTMKEMSLDDYKRLVHPDLCKQLNHIFFCGNYGDACASTNFFECVRYLRENDATLSIYTNGSMHGQTWWYSLAQILDDKCKVIFSIDGLKDTNKLYRVNSNFDRIMENVEAFIVGGGVARWDYLVFEHNKHQVKEAKKLARNMGFKLFNEKKTKRFIDNKNYKTNKGGGDFGDIVSRYGSWKNYIDETTITCKYRQDRILYIDFDLNLWPCCWVGAPLYFYGEDNIQKKQIKKLFDEYGQGFNSLRNKSIEEVLDHQWFKNDLVKSWSKTMDNGKLMTCGRTCGEEYHFSSGDKVNKRETVL